MGTRAHATGTGAAVVYQEREERLPEWDLSDLYRSRSDPALERDLAWADGEATALRSRHLGRIRERSGAELAQLIQRYERVEEVLDRVHAFAQLLFATRREDDEVARFYQGVRERVTEISTRLLFVTLELNKLEEEELEARLAESEELRRYRPWLRQLRAFRPHQLSDEVEQVLQEKTITSRSAWVRLFDETMAALRFPFDGRELTSAQIFDLLQHREREVRQKAAEAISEVLGRQVKLVARIHNTLTKDKQLEDSWRRFARPISSRNLANQVEDEVVDALIAAVREAYPRLSHRYYTLKAGWLGLPRLAHYDRNAPLPEDPDRRWSWEEARELVVEAYRRFSPAMAEIVTRFFERRWIDAGVRQGKDSGAFCHPTVPSVHPYVLMNFQGRTRDLMTLAHELGHGVHQVLAARQGHFLSGTPLTLAETASVFGEQLTFERLLAEEQDRRRRRALLAAKVEDMLNTVVRQIAFCEFEIAFHDRRRQAELTAEEIGELWMEVQRRSLGPAFELDDSYRVWWSYIPHFVHVPFYVYAYAFGECLVHALYSVYRSAPDGFAERYLALLEAGGTLRYDELLRPFGLDARDPAFWRRGLEVIARYIDELEQEVEASP